MFNESDVINSYTRADAIADGTLFDASKVAREAGFIIPVALSQAVMIDCVLWPESVATRKPGTAQDEDGRLWDVLYMARLAVARAGDSQRVKYTIHRVPTEGTGVAPVEVTLAMHVGPGDRGEPVITIMQPNED